MRHQRVFLQETGMKDKKQPKSERMLTRTENAKAGAEAQPIKHEKSQDRPKPTQAPPKKK